jgi:hypothetical protein
VSASETARPDANCRFLLVGMTAEGRGFMRLGPGRATLAVNPRLSGEGTLRAIYTAPGNDLARDFWLYSCRAGPRALGRRCARPTLVVRKILTPPRIADCGASAPTAVRPVRLKLGPAAGVVFRAHARGASLHSHPRRVGPRPPAWPRGRPRRAPRPADLCAPPLRRRAGGLVRRPRRVAGGREGRIPSRAPCLRPVYTNGIGGGDPIL